MAHIDDQDTLTHLDQWAPLSHKAAMGRRRDLRLAPTWVPPDDLRRLAAYTILAAYDSNVSRILLDGTQEAKDTRREYGDAALLVSRVVAAVLGETPQIVVDGAGHTPDDTPTLPPEPVLGDDPSDLDRRIHTARHARWETAAHTAVDEWEQAWQAWPALAAQQAALDKWARDEQLPARLLELNRDAVKLGDGVAELAVSTTRHRPVLRIHDPGFYFPVLTGGGEYPETVHLAWEETDDDDTRWVRRRTYRLVETVDRRRYPWAPDTDSHTTCVMSDGRWRLDKTEGATIADLSDRSAQWLPTEDGVDAYEVDLGIDFVPVVHLPNTPYSETHYGEAIVTRVAQLLDDIQASDSDLVKATNLAAVPILVTSGNKSLPTDFRVAPGQSAHVGENGRLDVVNMAGALPELRAGVDALLDRLSVNSQVSAQVMGRTDASEGMSGYALQLTFGPYTSLINNLRLTRDHKHALLLKFAGRMLQLTGQIDPGELAPARVVPGSFMPSDLADVTLRVTSLLQSKAISRRTGLAQLVDAGMSIDDAEAELDRIVAEDTQGAKEAAEATNSDQVAADRLGVELPERPELPSVSLPPAFDLGGDA